MEKTENQRLKIYRESKNMSQQQFADLIGIKQGSYSDQERGKVRVSGDVKVALFKEYSLNIDWLETGIGDMDLPNYLAIINELEKKVSSYESNAAAEPRTHYGKETKVDWELKFIEVDDKYKALLEDRLFEFLGRNRVSRSKA